MTWKGALGWDPSLDHLPELWPVGDSSTLRLVHELAGDGVVVLLSVVIQRPKLGSNGEVYVLAFAGYPGVEGGWCG